MTLTSSAGGAVPTSRANSYHLVSAHGYSEFGCHRETYRPLLLALLLQVSEASVNHGADGALVLGSQRHEAAVASVGDLWAGDKDYRTLGYGIDLDSDQNICGARWDGYPT